MPLLCPKSFKATDRQPPWILKGPAAVITAVVSFNQVFGSSAWSLSTGKIYREPGNPWKTPIYIYIQYININISIYCIHIINIYIYIDYIYVFYMFHGKHNRNKKNMGFLHSCFLKPTHWWSTIVSGWWFQPLWKILVSWCDYSQYLEK